MDISRKQFCASLAGATVTLWLQGCGGGGGDYGGGGGGGGGAVTCGAGVGNITGNHGHSLTILRVDLDSATPKTYALTAASTDGHIHSVTFSPAQLTTMKGGGSATVTSTTNTGHSHDVTASVAASCA